MHRESPPTAERVLVVGGGIAGLATALELAPLPVTVVSIAPLGQGASTAWAQGGIAAAIGPDDAPGLHAADTLAAGAGLVDEAVAQRVAAAAPACVDFLARLGVPFDRASDGGFALGMEGAHCRRRILHVSGDRSGRAILDALVRAVRATPSIEVLEGARVTELALDDGAIAGAFMQRAGVPHLLPARAVVLATGGVGGLYAATTNPAGALGGGLALAARAGARLRDAEFVQFHPTAMDLGRDPMPLASEALRGEGAVLIDDDGARILADVPGGELAARDVVAREIHRCLAAGKRVYLDTRAAIGAELPARFPTVTAFCREARLDPVEDPIPVRPAVHYHMGGVAVDAQGRSSLAGLWACGEVAATGLHGANRLASNSLLEAVAFARWIAEDIEAERAPRRRLRPAPCTPPGGEVRPRRLAMLRRLMEAQVGVVRTETGLAQAAAELAGLAFDESRAPVERDAALAGLLIAAAASQRRESRGGHYRADAPEPSPAFQRSCAYTLAEVRRAVEAQEAEKSVAVAR